MFSFRNWLVSSPVTSFTPSRFETLSPTGRSLRVVWEPKGERGKAPFRSQTKAMLNCTDLCKCRLLAENQRPSLLHLGLSLQGLVSAGRGFAPLPLRMCWSRACRVSRPGDRFRGKDRQPVPFSQRRRRRHAHHIMVPAE